MTQQYMSLDAALAHWMQRQLSQSLEGKRDTYSTGFQTLDQLISGGLKAGDLYVLAGRPSMGKSSLAINIASNITSHHELAVFYCAMSLSAQTIATRLLGSEAGLPVSSLSNIPSIGPEYSRVLEAKKRLKNKWIFIDETPWLSSHDICSRCEQFSLAIKKPGLIIVDSMSFIPSLARQDATDTHFADAMSGFKKLACDMNAAVLLISDLKSTLEGRANKRPESLDLPSLEIEKHADVMMFLYRDEVYQEETEQQGWAEISLVRNRYGSTGMALIGSSKLAYGNFVEPEFSSYRPE